MRLDRRSLLVVATALVVTAAVLMAPFGPGPAIVARITTDTPDAQLVIDGPHVARAGLRLEPFRSTVEEAVLTDRRRHIAETRVATFMALDDPEPMIGIHPRVDTSR